MTAWAWPAEPSRQTRPRRRHDPMRRPTAVPPGLRPALRKDDAMSKGYPSMTALLGLLAVAGYQNRDRIAEWLGGHAKDPARSPAPQVPPATGSTIPANLDRLLGGASAGRRRPHRRRPDRAGRSFHQGRPCRDGAILDQSRPEPRHPGRGSGARHRAGHVGGPGAAHGPEQERAVGAPLARPALGHRSLLARRTTAGLQLIRFAEVVAATPRRPPPTIPAAATRPTRPPSPSARPRWSDPGWRPSSG